ncbi:MAG: 3-alpha domain-containing protein [Gemmatimonadales bacterium]
MSLNTTERKNVELLRCAASVPALGESWRWFVSHQLEKLEGQPS